MQRAVIEQGPAIFSEDRRYRYALVRRWKEGGLVNFIMLNPSTADENTLDPTLRRCARYALDWNYGGMVITNLFAFRATDPRAMRAAEDPVGPYNDAFIEENARDAGIVIVGWGAHGDHMRRDLAVKKILRRVGTQVYALKVTKGGHPGHPLYLRRDAEAVAFDLTTGVAA